MLTGGDLVFSAGLGSQHLPPQPRALLASLLLNPGAGVSRDWLADLLWPDADQLTARRRLRATLLNLRNALENTVVPKFEASRDLIQLAIEPMQIDVFQFESAAASDHPETRAMACDLYRGNLLARFPPISTEFDLFLEERRAGLRSVAISLLLETMQSARARRDMSGFERAFQRAVRIEPANSVTASLAMETWAEQGFGERMEEEYQRFRSAYADAFDAPPPDGVAETYRDLIGKLERTPKVTLEAGWRRGSEKAGPYQSGKQAPVGNRKRRIALLTGILALLLLSDLAWVFRPQQPAGGGPVIVLRTVEVVEDGCTIADVGRRYRQEIRDGLEDLEGASLVVGPVGRMLSRLGGSAFELTQSVNCRGSLLRATLTLSRREAGEVVWIGRFDTKNGDMERISNRVKAELSPVLSHYRN